MSIKKLNSNRFRVDAYLGEGLKRRRIRKTFDTKTEAKDFDAELRRESKITSSRALTDRYTRTILDLVKYYYSLPRFNLLRPRSQLRNRQLISRFVNWCNTEGIKYAHEVTKETAQQYINYIMEIAKRKGRQHHFITVKMLFTEDLDRDYPSIERNPFPKHCPFEAQKYKPIAMDEALMNKLRMHMTALERDIFDLMYYTGPRSSELLYLTWDQVYNGKVRYGNHQIYDVKTKTYIEWKTKTADEREVSLNQNCAVCLDRLGKLNVSHNFVLPHECRDDIHWLLRTFEKIKRRTVQTYPELKEILFPVDKQKNITPKRFRSTFISHLIRESGNPEIARNAAGHKDIKTTINHYTDSSALDLKNAVGKLNLDRMAD